jgi:hypothetical protein
VGIFDKWFGRTTTATSSVPATRPQTEVTVAAKDDESVTVTFNNKNITYNGELAGLDYNAILRDKQNYNNIQNLFA